MLRLCLGVIALSALILVAPTAASQDAPPTAATAKPSAAIVNLNTATVIQLEALPGIGAKTAALILEYRQKNGGFKKIEELMNVKGIGERSFLKIRALVTVTAPRSDRDAAARAGADQVR